MREIVRARCGGRCERCGTSLTAVPASLHHRKPRRMGGTRDAEVNYVSNLMYVCGTGTTGCHGWIESHRKDAYVDGWLLGANEAPDRTPVYVYKLGPVLLSGDGSYSPLTGGD